MAGSATRSGSSIKLGKSLQRNAQLSAKVRKLEGLMRSIFGEEIPIEWDKVPDSQCLSLKVGTPGKGECTRWPLESFLDEPAEMEKIFRDMKETLDYLSSYLDEVDRLFQQLRSWLKETSSAFQVEEVPIKITEAFTGEYTAAKLIIRSGHQSVEVRPIAAWSVGTEGRVDLIGPEQKHTLILSRAEGGWLWVDDRQVVALRPLTRDLFIDLVKDCMQ